MVMFVAAADDDDGNDGCGFFFSFAPSFLINEILFVTDAWCLDFNEHKDVVILLTHAQQNDAVSVIKILCERWIFKRFVWKVVCANGNEEKDVDCERKCWVETITILTNWIRMISSFASAIRFTYHLYACVGQVKISERLRISHSQWFCNFDMFTFYWFWYFYN